MLDIRSSLPSAPILALIGPRSFRKNFLYAIIIFLGFRDCCTLLVKLFYTFKSRIFYMSFCLYFLLFCLPSYTVEGALYKGFIFNIR